MADAAVPSDGGERPVHVLSGWAGHARAALLGAALVSGAPFGCDAGGPSPVADASTPAGAPGALVGALLARVGEDGGGEGRGVPPRAPRWPSDLRLHPDARAESIELDAVLEEPDGTRHSLVRRFDRLTVRGPDDGTSVGGEDFRFRDVVRLSGTVATTGGPTPSRREALERATLGLAGAGEHDLRVRDVTLELSDGTAAGETAAHGVRGDSCRMRYTLSEGDGSELVFGGNACPAAARVGSLTIATSATLAVSGALVVDGETRVVAGRGWVRRAWGDPPAPGGAVVFDRLVLELDGLGLVDAARSKRRSGRGPSITSADLRRAGDVGAGAGIVALEDIEWHDDAARAADGGATAPTANGRGAAGEVPARWTLRSAADGIDVVLRAIVEESRDGPLADDGLERTWRGAVTASGSHAGIGFVEFRAIGRASDADPTASR